MTDWSSQPSIADAARLMDSLGLAQGTETSVSSAISSRQPGPQLLDARHPPRSPASEVGYEKHHGKPYDTRRFNATGSGIETAPGPDFSSLSASRWNKDSTRIPSLPAEIIYQIATHLVSSSDVPLHSSTEMRPAAFPCEHSFPPHTSLLPSGSNLHALLSLSSSNRAFRNTLVPLVWHTIVIRTPQHLPRLAALLKSYDTLSVRSTSPQRHRKSSIPSSDLLAGGLRHPLPHIRSIHISIPDKYMDLDQSYLLTLLRSMHLSQTHQLDHLHWSAEAAPNPAIWSVLAPSLRSLELDGRTFYQGHKGMEGLERLESFKMVGFESTLLPSGVVGVFWRQRRDEGGKGEDQELREVPEGEEEEGRRGIPVVELQSVTPERKRQARHLYLDPSPPPPPSAGPDPHPPHAASPSATHTRLKHLSLCTSKTSLFHQQSLLRSSAFQGLTHIDIYPITPQPPLSLSLISTASTLTHLRLVLDISGAFANYDALWSDLTGRLPELVWLEVDPMPQQNTAPSFGRFVEEAGKLRWINGKEVGSFPPCFGDFDPGKSSGALPF
ncbi:hypothetical protein PHSY_000871 [Pseudozyma hubeiensis SY62]|uniref:Uncharacterized protein n=1 Tax=Pseudozyma hubeiensis (strain SY62) TaxID=1305764 RepID=R9NXJ3_PSEHS|nr:hypothetical protein PHSY_000871 [Pseudozyma hubeiensis SY62]GAC93306.1 hypothetical protein PHSY_000871 [Pseudozyma hubeiensis SY62]